MARIRKGNKKAVGSDNVLKKCSTPYCTRKARGSLCRTCESRKYRAANAMRYAFQTLRNNVYRRKGRNFWALTFDEFKKYAIETKYITGKGKFKTSYTIDAVDNEMGYFIGNIRTIPNTDNSKKRQKILTYEWVEEVGCMVAILTDNKKGVVFHSEQHK